jgi:hypothetical protein
LKQLTDTEKDALIVELWEDNQSLHRQLVIAKVKAYPHCAATIAESEQKLHTVYDKIEITPIKPIVNRVNQ